MKVVTSPGILLRSHPYSESSRILRFLTPELGIVSLLGKGIGRRGASRGHAVETFGEATITFSHRPDRDLHTLREHERIEGARALGTDMRRFLGASLLAELLLAHALQQGDPALYVWVRTALDRLGSAPESELPGWILAGSWKTLAFLGFSPDLDRCIACAAGLGRVLEGNVDRFDAAAGGMRCVRCSEGGALPRVGPTARGHLAALVRGEPPPDLIGSSAHLALLEAFCLHHLAPGREFRTFGMLRPLLEGARAEN